MLVLRRRVDQSIEVDGPCRITVQEIHAKLVVLGIQAAHDTTILRGELAEDEEQRYRWLAKEGRL